MLRVWSLHFPKNLCLPNVIHWGVERNRHLFPCLLLPQALKDVWPIKKNTARKCFHTTCADSFQLTGGKLPLIKWDYGECWKERGEIGESKGETRTGEWDLERSKGQLYSHTLKQTQDPGALAISRTAYFDNVSWCIPFSAADRATLLLSVTFITQRHSTASSRSECYQPPNTESVVFDIENCCISHCMHLHLFNF